MSEDMRRLFQNRDELIAYLRIEFPEANAVSPHVSEMRGGRTMAEQRLGVIDPGKAYRDTRNDLNGAVTRLSPYLRYGVLSLSEVRDFAFQHVSNPDEVEKFINELGWRDYFQQVYHEIGDEIWEDIEPYKTGFNTTHYAAILPDDIRNGETGIPFIDDFIEELYTTGYLHNHARMWLAAYVVHWRRIRWQVGARWFLEHLLDGDPASNNLSWQWVASTFSHKPYYYNLANVRQYTGSRYLEHHASYEEFTGSYGMIARRLFPHADLEDTKARNQRGERNKPTQKHDRKR